jgi:hypothetical protein
MGKEEEDYADLGGWKYEADCATVARVAHREIRLSESGAHASSINQSDLAHKRHCDACVWWCVFMSAYVSVDVSSVSKRAILGCVCPPILCPPIHATLPESAVIRPESCPVRTQFSLPFDSHDEDLYHN